MNPSERTRRSPYLSFVDRRIVERGSGVARFRRPPEAARVWSPSKLPDFFAAAAGFPRARLRIPMRRSSRQVVSYRGVEESVARCAPGTPHSIRWLASALPSFPFCNRQCRGTMEEQHAAEPAMLSVHAAACPYLQPTAQIRIASLNIATRHGPEFLHAIAQRTGSPEGGHPAASGGRRQPA